MPTVLRLDGFRVKVNNPPREHGPAHVHVAKAGGDVVIELDPISVVRVVNMRTADVVAAVRLVVEHQDVLLAAWRERHG